MGARVISDESRNRRFRRSADEEADRAAREPEDVLEVRILWWRVGDFPEATEARGGAWQGFG